jgi:alpha-galactosidase/6-phospho-beta-glucosidase family protein
MKIVIVGGGSKAWTPTVVRDVLLTEPLSGAEIVLHDIDRAASDLMKAFCDKLARKIGASARFISTDDRRQALEDADYVVITISTGGLDSMAHDLAIPEEYGIYHTVGDTSGPGGWARFIRNFDTFVSLANDISRYAPGSVVLNYTNPMSTLTAVLAHLYDGPVIGLCHGLFENLAFIKDYYGMESEDEIHLRYGGLNHFFWVTEARAGQTDVLSDLSREIESRSFTDLLRETQEDAMGFSSSREVATELFRLTGVMPYLGDRHTCEFFSWYITGRQRMEKYGIVRTTVAERRESLETRSRQLLGMIKDEIPDGYFRRSRETAADIIEAHSQGRTFIDVGNLPNTGQISSLPCGVVVETAVRVDGTGFSPITFGPLPDSVQGFVEPWANVYALCVRACFEKDRTLALQALRLDPVCSHLGTPEVCEMGERLLNAHKRFISVF